MKLTLKLLVGWYNDIKGDVPTSQEVVDWMDVREKELIDDDFCRF